ncbi:RNase P subunit p30-domain-containing protein [Xylariaceae sp. FL1272]|nr:RNase P subunit p30-domain-containing protein [Xylariaceae sp. FL1272]
MPPASFLLFFSFDIGSWIDNSNNHKATSSLGLPLAALYHDDYEAIVFHRHSHRALRPPLFDMHYDLNLAWSPTTTPDELDRTLRFSASLGYGAVALNHTIAAPIPIKFTNPIPLIPPCEPGASSPKQPAVLRRATVIYSDNAINHQLPQIAHAYDILALRPTTDDAFAHACYSVENVSLISLDFTQRHHMSLRPKPCMAAVERGVRFEICYSHALHGPSPGHIMGAAAVDSRPGPGQVGQVDARARANFIGNVTTLIRCTRGRGIVLSSEARSALALRGPADVVNLLNVWGLSTDRANEALTATPRSVVANEAMRRTGFRGVVDIMSTAPRSEKPDVDMADAQPLQGDQNKTKNNNKQDTKKRKGSNEGDNNKTTTTPGDGTNATFSKRQKQKMKREAKQKGEADAAARSTS